jgi:hypothetical protein
MRIPSATQQRLALSGDSPEAVQPQGAAGAPSGRVTGTREPLYLRASAGTSSPKPIDQPVERDDLAGASRASSAMRARCRALAIWGGRSPSRTFRGPKPYLFYQRHSHSLADRPPSLSI